MSRAEQIERVALAISTRGAFVGERFSAGCYTPAVPALHAFCVLNLQGSPVVLAHDAFEAARWFVDLEAGALEDVGELIELSTDADIAADRTEERTWPIRLSMQYTNPNNRS